MNKKVFEDYDKFLEIITLMEDEEECPTCGNGSYLISCSPFSYEFLCPKCGKVVDLERKAKVYERMRTDVNGSCKTKKKGER